MASERSIRGQNGQVSVAFIAVVPGLIVAALAAITFALVGHAAFSAANAARAGARAAYVGSDVEASARRALPAGLRDGLEVATDEASTRVEIQAPTALPFLGPITVGASADLAPDGGMADG